MEKTIEIYTARNKESDIIEEAENGIEQLFCISQKEFDELGFENATVYRVTIKVERV